MLKFFCYLKIKEEKDFGGEGKSRIDTENICWEIDRERYEAIKQLLGG